MSGEELNITSGQELEDRLVEANPYHRRTLSNHIPPAVGEIAVREITAVGPGSFWHRIKYRFDEHGTPAAWGRVGFVSVLAAAVVVAALAVNPSLLSGDANDDLAVPTDTAEGADGVGDPVPEQTRTVVVPPLDSTSPPSTSPDGEASSTSASVGSDPAPDGATPPRSSPTTATAEQTCTASGPSLNQAVDAYDRTCSQPRADCDPVDGRWVCSGSQLGDLPGGDPQPGQASGSRTGPAVVTDGDCVTIEVERLNLVGSWNIGNDSRASGGSYAVWEGLSFEQNNTTPTDIIDTSITITNPGTYRFLWLMRQPFEAAVDRANGSWVNVPDADRFGPAGGGGYGGFVNVYGNARGTFGWSTAADQDERSTEIAIRFDRPGTYTLQLAGRSHGHEIDKIVLHRDSVSRADAISGGCGRSGQSAGPSRPPTATVGGPFDSGRDLISLHYDHAPDFDDGQATVAAKVMADSHGVIPWVIGGAYGTNRDGYRPDSQAVMDATWGGGWVNANADWGLAVRRTADRWQNTLDAGGAIWVAEGGQSDLTADVVRELKRRSPGLDSRSRVHVVQHSQWNEGKTTTADLTYVRNNTDYLRIEDGNWLNATADLNTVTPGFEQRARDSRWGSAWAAAFDYLDPDDRLDFSDTVALLFILEVATSEVASPGDFADRFFG